MEGWFYLWRVTGKQQYRDWCWEVVEALERHCRATAGYTGIRNVNSLPVNNLLLIFFKCGFVHIFSGLRMMISPFLSSSNSCVFLDLSSCRIKNKFRAV